MNKEKIAMIIRLTKEHIRLLTEETRKKYPIEACGLLFGDISSKDAVVRKIILVQNILESSTNFQIDPEEFLNASFIAEEEGMQHIGFFHSHPAAANPSVTDNRYMKLWPENIWLIISSVDYDMGAYQTSDSGFRRIDIKVNSKR